MEQIENYNKPPRPSNYLVLAILSTIACCLPLGIVSIIYAAKVNSEYDHGNYLAAESASKNAKIWGLVSVGAFVLIMVLYFIIIGLALIGGALDA